MRGKPIRSRKQLKRKLGRRAKTMITGVLCVGLVLGGSLMYMSGTEKGITFAATVNYELVDADGNVIEDNKTVAADNEEYTYSINVGQNNSMIMASWEDAMEVIEDVEKHYVTDDMDVKDVQIDPKITVKANPVGSGASSELKQQATSVDEAVDNILRGDAEQAEYQVQSGDTAMDVAVAKGMTMDEMQLMNADVDLDNIAEGDTLNVKETKPLVDVTVTTEETGTEEVEYETKEIKTDDLFEGDTEVKTQGKNGSQDVVNEVTFVNGELQATETVEATTIKEAKSEVVYVGTRIHTGEGTGEDVVEFALQFLGNPYVWGGSSLTNGADCSGFTMAVFNHFNVSLPHSSYAQENYGIPVKSLKDAKPGDLICYGSHVAIYMGDGRIVHASNPRTDITTGSATYRGIKEIRRLL